MKIEIVEVTPELAKTWMEKNTHNRVIRPGTVNMYARDMTAGNWKMTGETIKFNKAGDLIDGQHRLQAVIKADITIKLLVVDGLDQDVQEVMDTGIKRSTSDALQLQGFKNTTTLASAARLMMTLEAYEKAGAELPANADIRSLSRDNVQFTHTEISEYIYEHPELVEATEFASASRKIPYLQPAVIAVAWYTLFRVDQHDCREFFSSLANAATDGYGDPRAALLSRLYQADRIGERLSAGVKLSMVYRVWNAWRHSEKMHKIPAYRSINGKPMTLKIQTPI